MSFKISIATLDGKNVNKHFGQYEQFYVFQVGSDGLYNQLGVRISHEPQDSVHL